MTHPAAAIAGVVSVVAIVAVVGALRLSPDAGTDKLVDNGSAAFEGTQKFRERFGDDAIVVLAEGDLKKLMLTERHRPAARARDLPRRPARRDRAVRGAGLPGDRRSRRDPGRLRAGDLHQRGGRALERGDRAADPVAAGASPREQQQALHAVPRRPASASGDGPPGAVDRQRPVRLLDRLRPDASRRPAEVEVRLPVPERPRRADLDPPAARRLRVRPARGDRADPRGDRRRRVRAPGRQLRDLRRSRSSSRASPTSSAARSRSCSRAALRRHGDRPARSSSGRRCGCCRS